MSARSTDSQSRTQPETDLRSAFRKEACCPSSEELFQYCQHSPRARSERCAELDRHLATCDFCCAELHLLAAHPLRHDKSGCKPVQIPVHLYALARALLAHPRDPHSVEATHAATALTLTDA